MTTKKCIWLTDTHFNFVLKPKLVEYFSDIQAQNPDYLFITGDISNGLQLVKHLRLLSRIVHCPIYFTLGNHDFYQSDFKSVEKSMVKIMDEEPNLFYMTNCSHISLSHDTAVIGDDGWYDARWRVPYTPLIFIWDYFFIKNFRILDSNEKRMALVREKAKMASITIGKKLRRALESHSTVYLLTHFPPWPDSKKWVKELFWMPYNSSKIIADEISSIMKDFPSKKLIVLAGHTHCERIDKISENIELRVGTARHTHCQIQETILI